MRCGLAAPLYHWVFLERCVHLVIMRQDASAVSRRGYGGRASNSSEKLLEDRSISVQTQAFLNYFFELLICKVVLLGLVF